jgi:hypothetical protein
MRSMLVLQVCFLQHVHYLLAFQASWAPNCRQSPKPWLLAATQSPSVRAGGQWNFDQALVLDDSDILSVVRFSSLHQPTTS